MPLVVLFPLIFVGIGAIGIYSAWRPGSAAEAVSRPISDRAGGTSGIRFAMMFFAMFAILGGVIFFFVTVRPLSKILSARQWAAVPCTIISSEVKSHSGNHGSTYSVNIFYDYVLNDREYKANRYDFLGGSSSGFSGKQAIVARYPAGSKALCYVNPADPAEAVLERSFTPVMWVGLLPLAFVLLGLAGVVSTVRKGRMMASMRGPVEHSQTGIWQSDVIPRFTGSARGEPLLLKQQAGPRAKLLGSIAFALFWNGIVSVFVFQVLKHWGSCVF